MNQNLCVNKTFPYERLHTGTCFETEVKGNSEIVYINVIYQHLGITPPFLYISDHEDPQFEMDI